MITPEVIRGYRITTKFHNAGGGQCQWAFAEKNGVQYFIKRFLQPTFPLPEGPGSAETKARKLEACKAFEKRHETMMSALAKLSKGGSVIVAKEFFREGTKYYKVTEKVDVASSIVVHTLPFAERVLLATVVANSVAVLHRAGIVHGDLKPPNVLLKTTDKGIVTAKLIDFDDSYLSGSPPPPDVLVGDIVYYSPEAHQYVLGEGKGTNLTTAADIFALGVLFCEYFTGQRPRAKSGKPDSTTCAAVVLNGETLRTGVDSLDADLAALLTRMLSRDPALRPSIQEVFLALKEVRRRPSTPVGHRSLPDAPTASGTRLRGTLLNKAETEAPVSVPSPPPSSGSRLKGSLAPVDKSK